MQYGRLIDYLQPSHYLQILKHALGNELLNANLCESMDDAKDCLNLMKIFNYEHREKFIIFSHYSHKFKDTML